MRRILPLFLILAAAVPAAALLVPGTEKLASPIAVGPAPGGDLLEAVATDGTDFLVVWSTSSWEAGREGLFAAKVTESGAVSPMPGLRLTGDPGAADPSVVWTGNAYLVMWDSVSTGSLMAARVDRDARLIGEPFRVTTGFNLYALAWDGRRAMALSSDTTGLKILMLGPEGNIVRETRVDGVTITGEVGLVAAGGGFVAVWSMSQRVGTATVYAMRFSRDGDPAGAPVLLPVPTSQGVNLDVDTDGERVGVAYTEDPNRTGGNLSAPRPLRRYTLDARTLAVTEHPVLQSTSFPEVVPTPGGFVSAVIDARGEASILDAFPFESTEPRSNDVTPASETTLLTASNGRSVLAVWSRGHVAGAVFDASLTEKKTPVVTVSTSIIEQSRPALAPAGDVALHTWVEETVEGGNLVAARIDRFGNPLDPPRLVAGGEWMWLGHSAVFAGRVWLVSYRTRGRGGSPETFLRRVGLDGVPLDEPPLELGLVGTAAMASNRDVTLVAAPSAQGLRVWRFSADGTQLDATSTIVDTMTYSSVDIATNGREFLLVYERDKKLVGRRFGVTGNLIDAAAIAIDNTPAANGSFSVASDGTDYYVAFQRFLELSKTAVIVKRVLRIGQLAGATASGGGTHVGDGAIPRIAFLGTRAVLAFVSNPGEPSRLYLAEVGGETITVSEPVQRTGHALASRGSSLWLSYVRMVDFNRPAERVFVRAVDDTPPGRRRTARQ